MYSYEDIVTSTKANLSTCNTIAVYEDEERTRAIMYVVRAVRYLASMEVAKAYCGAKPVDMSWHNSLPTPPGFITTVGQSVRIVDRRNCPSGGLTCVISEARIVSVWLTTEFMG